MQVIINGEKREVLDSMSLTSLVEELGMKAGRVAIELNGTIISRDHWGETLLSNGDRLEIVHFVGGGK